MKNATRYEKKVRKLLGKSPGARGGTDGEEGPVQVLIRSVLEEDADGKDVRQAIAALEEEFVDFNELRVSPPKDIVECIGRDHPNIRQKAHMLVKVLNGIFDRVFVISLQYMEKMTKRDLRRHLRELGLSPYAAASAVLRVFEGHAVPVDRTLVECLEMDGYIHPGSDLEDVQGFLERIVSHKNAGATHEALRDYVGKSAKALAKWRQAAAKAAAKAAAAQAKQDAEKEAQEKLAKKKKRKKARGKAAGKTSGRKAAPKARKKTKARRSAAAGKTTSKKTAQKK